MMRMITLSDAAGEILDRMAEVKKLPNVNAAVMELIEQSNAFDERDELRKKLKEYETFEFEMREAIQEVWSGSPVAKQYLIDTGEEMGLL